MADTEVRQLIDENSRPSDTIVYTDGSVKRSVKSGWGFAAFRDGRIIHKSSGACTTTTSSTRMEIEAVTKAMEWLQQKMHDTRHVVIVTDSQNVLKRVDNGTLRNEWLRSIEGTRLRKITWIYAPSHTGVAGNEQADKLASNAPVNTSIKMDKRDIMKTLTATLVDEEIEQHKTAVIRLEALEVMRGSGRTSTLTGVSRRLTNQMATGTISRQTLCWILGRGTEHLWQCPECHDVVPVIK